MKKLFLLASMLAFTLQFTSVRAAPITEIWQAEVLNTTHTAAAAIGDILSWTVTYDDTSRYMRQYWDGPDGKAQTADDTVNIVWDVEAPAYASDWNVFSDAVFDFGNIFSRMEQVVFDSSLVLRDAYNINEFLFYGGDTKNRYEYVADNRDLFLIDNLDPLINDTARFNVYYHYTDGSPQSVRIDVGNFVKSEASVPEPGTLALLLSGMLLLQRRKGGKKFS